MKIAQLIAVLRTKDQAAEVEFIVCKTTGELVTMDVSGSAHDMARALQLFGGRNEADTGDSGRG